MSTFIRLIEFFEKIILKIIDKMNIVILLLVLVLLGYMQQDQVFAWLKVIGESFKGIIP